MHVNLKDAAAALPVDGWKRRILADFGGLRAKLFRIDPAGLAEATHADWDEALLMIDGELRFELGDAVLDLAAGDFCVIPRGVPHRILPGGRGAFVLLDPEPA